MSSVISIQNLGKKYILSHQSQERYTALRDVMADGVKHLGRRLFHPFAATNNDPTREEFWALKDVSFDIQQGDRVGIIGRNGAGKSTLLKVLSRITEPTAGKVKIKGRVASLLEVGTGFHPELTGRENIYLNGAILGMSKAEIRRKFDEIVVFAEVEQFLDTPVKRYSSGMYVRLAFSVAAHLEPEILIVDEVLAVGDAQFQMKCLGRMEEVSTEGRTVVFVSHNMGAISQLCNKSVLLHKGRAIHFGATSEVVDHYLERSSSQVKKISRGSEIEGNHFHSIFMCDKDLSERTDYRFDEDIHIYVELALPEFSDSLELAMRLVDRNKRAIFTIHEKLVNYVKGHKAANLLLQIPRHFLTPGRYSWVMCINHPHVVAHDLQDDVLPFTIIETGSEFARYEGADYGCVFANYSIRQI